MEALILNPKYHTLLSLLKGIRNGIAYGVKIRASHAFVNTFLFRDGSLQSKLRAVFKATKSHATNLAKFVFIYKLLTWALKTVHGDTAQIHSFLAAFIGGWFVFGKNNAINMQINLYLLSRVLLALVKLLAARGSIAKPSFDAFPWFAALVWGAVLWLFEHHGALLQPSLQSSMTYLYHDSNAWDSLRTLLVHNK